MPSIIYNINDDWELMLTAQSAFGELKTKFQAMGSGIYLRTMNGSIKLMNLFI